MNKPANIEAAPLALLRKPFEPHHISKLPKPTKAQTDAVKADYKKGIRCKICGSWHHPDVDHLDYVGHAALTDRLLDTDPYWYWEPAGFTPEGLPAHDRNGGLWIKLTVCGITRYGYGAADGKTGGDAVKEIIGDALRNAAMRFGAALDLWHKGDLHLDEESAAPANDANERVNNPTPVVKKAKMPPLAGPYTSKTALWQAVRKFSHELHGCGDSDMLEAFLADKDSVALLAQCERDAPNLLRDSDIPDYVPLDDLIAKMRSDFENLENNVLRAG
jgi:hypothetical protein